MNNFRRRTRNACTTPAPKIGFISDFGALGFIQVKALNITSSIQHCITTERCKDVSLIISMWAQSNTYTRSQSNTWKLRHHTSEALLTIVSVLCFANQVTSRIAAGAGARRAQTPNVLKGLFLHLSRHGHGMPHVCVFDVYLLFVVLLGCYTVVRVDPPNFGWLD